LGFAGLILEVNDVRFIILCESSFKLKEKIEIKRRQSIFAKEYDEAKKMEEGEK
jgi:hypothetical protein